MLVYIYVCGMYVLVRLHLCRIFRCILTALTVFRLIVSGPQQVQWSQERFDEIVEKLKTFLKQAGFKARPGALPV